MTLWTTKPVEKYYYEPWFAVRVKQAGDPAKQNAIRKLVWRGNLSGICRLFFTSFHYLLAQGYSEVVEWKLPQSREGSAMDAKCCGQSFNKAPERERSWSVEVHKGSPRHVNY